MWCKAEVRVVATVVFDDEEEATLFRTACLDASCDRSLTTSQANVMARFVDVMHAAQEEANEIRNYLPQRGAR